MKRSACFALFAGTLASGLAAAQAQELSIEQADVTTHRSQGEIRPVEGGNARLLRTAGGVFFDFETRGLTPGHAYTLLLAAINNPDACEASPCQPTDVLGNAEATQSDLATVDGAIAGEDGTARFAAFLPLGQLPNGWIGAGLANPEGAEFHLIVNDHGPLISGMAAAMVGTYRAGCADEGLPAAFPESAKADGEPGPNTCRLLQVAIFSPASA
jgi:hypothetical protein